MFTARYIARTFSGGIASIRMLHVLRIKPPSPPRVSHNRRSTEDQQAALAPADGAQSRQECVACES